MAGTRREDPVRRKEVQQMVGIPAITMPGSGVLVVVLAGSVVVSVFVGALLGVAGLASASRHRQRRDAPDERREDLRTAA
jgi:uncharacterized protein (DUF2062 family)